MEMTELYTILFYTTI